ncbi:SCAN domain-containing protein [Pimephales promelas]|nr:SCAN domain-containing protein [Pimephales promelas]
MSAVAETLLEGKQKEDMCVKIKQIPMSASSATKKTEILTQDVLAQLDEAIHKAPCIGLAVDESTDVSDNAQLLVFVRFFNIDKEKFCEDLLGVTPLQTSTRGEDIYLAIKEMLKKRAIEMKQEDLVHRGDSVVSEEILSDNPVHLKLVLDNITIDNQHFLQGTCDYSLTNQRPLSRVKRSPPRRIPNPSSGSRETPATSSTETPLGSNKVKVESKSELLECAVTEETDNATTQVPVVPMQDAPLANEHKQQPVSTFSDSIVHYNQPCKLLNSTSKHILRSRVENTVHTGDVHSVPSMSESREILHSCHVCGSVVYPI